MAKLLKARLTSENVGNDFLKRPRTREEILGRVRASMSLTQGMTMVIHGRLGGMGKRKREAKMCRFWLE